MISNRYGDGHGYGVQQTFFFSFWAIFLPIYPPSNPKNQNLEKLKERPKEIIISNMCTIKDNYMMYGS